MKGENKVHPQAIDTLNFVAHRAPQGILKLLTYSQRIFWVLSGIDDNQICRRRYGGDCCFLIVQRQAVLFPLLCAPLSISVSWREKGFVVFTI
jgi:hypothetical protein